MATQSTAEAMRLLRATRKDLIDMGRNIAKQICERKGTVHSREVFEEMRDEVEAAGIGAYFLGVVFGGKDFAWTGEWYNIQPDEKRNIHGSHAVKVWRLRG